MELPLSFEEGFGFCVVNPGKFTTVRSGQQRPHSPELSMRQQP